MFIQKIIIGVLSFFLLTTVATSNTFPFKQNVYAQSCTAGQSCTTLQGCPGVCGSSGICQDIADNCPPQPSGAPAGGRIINPILNTTLQGQTGIDFFGNLVPRLVTLGFIIGSLIFFFILIIGAIQWISSGGDKNAIEEAKHKITNAIIGIVILFLIFVIMKVIESFFGISILTLDIGNLAL
jgi:hypothetical protein